MSEISLLPNLPDYSQVTTNRNASSINIFTQVPNPNLSKWKILFSRKATGGMVFKPKLGRQIYPCYACRNIFGSKNSFLDHVNRRGILLKYKCSYCLHPETWTFYNPCSLLLHTRQHYTQFGGQINLEGLEVSMLPLGLGGFLPHPDVPMIYDVVDDSIGETQLICCKFYNPIEECMGNSLVNLVPSELLFYCADESTREITALRLRQMSLNIPRCQFILNETSRFGLALSSSDINGILLQPGESCVVTVKQETHEPYNSAPIPVVSKPEPSKEQPTLLRKLILPAKCAECHQPQTVAMREHFIRTNQPVLQSLQCSICKYIAPTKCSLQAHERLHENKPPHVCPECGRTLPHWKSLNEHMNDVCFHLNKQVRIKCSGKRCGKIFAQMTTFSSHFLSHLKVFLRCMLCGDISQDEAEYFQHSGMHEIEQLPTKMFKCIACTDSDEIFTQDTLSEHIRQHAINKYLYVYICRHCHSYFRSPTTYGTHLLRCTRLIPPQVNPNLLTYQQSSKMHVCRMCKTKIAPQYLQKSNSCPMCGWIVDSTIHNGDSSSDTDQMFCPLCDQELILNEIEEHMQNRCRYSKPVIFLRDCTSNKHELFKDEVFSPKSDDSSSSIRKRRRKLQSLYKNRCLSASNSEPDLTIDIDDIAPFDGTYHCKLCDYKNEIRDNFHSHITTHRSISTAYQCMECGECFVVKPSLIKHLLFYHQVNDVDKYFQDNNCFDRKAVEELEKMTQLLSCETREQVEENQCTVCLCKFSDNVELGKHFRIHGMAFLMKNTK